MNVKIYSRKELNARLKEGKLENTLLIAFYDPQEDLPTFSGKAERLITLPIPDLDIESLEEYGYTIDTYFTQAEKIAEFIINCVKDGMDIVCQCEYGESRSAGCAAAIKEFYDGNGIEIFADYRYYPNKIIYNKLLAALQKKQELRNGRCFIHRLPIDENMGLALMNMGYLSAGKQCGRFCEFKQGDAVLVPLANDEFMAFEVTGAPQGIAALSGTELNYKNKTANITKEGVLYEGEMLNIGYVVKVKKLTEKRMPRSVLNEELRMKMRARRTNEEVHYGYRLE